VITVVFLGLVGGLITGISPCVLPVLPVVFLSGGTGRSGGSAQFRPVDDGRAAVTAPAPRTGARPVAVVAGLALSFSVFTLLGTLILDALHLPDDLVHWLGIIVLALIGIGMVVPWIGHLLERPFSWIPQRAVSTDRNGFVLGLVLGAVYVPCAGPVLAAISVAGATGKIGVETIALTIAFAVGTAVPLLVFAVAGEQVTRRVRAFRKRERVVRVVAGVVVVGLAVGLAFNITDAVQKAIPDYTQALDNALNRAGASTALSGGSGATGSDAEKLSACVTEASVLQATSLRECGKAPKIGGISTWLNTTDGKPVTQAELKGKVVLVDFWAYSCINCQRAIPHVEAWYKNYEKDGLVVVGVHTPEYAFEHVASNVAAGVKRNGITYPVALDNEDTTWNRFANESWPADYLIDAQGDVRHVGIGEGDYPQTESLIRQLLTQASPGVRLPKATDVKDTTPTDQEQTPETYLGSERSNAFAGSESYSDGTRSYAFPSTLPSNEYALKGSWTVASQSITAGDGAAIEMSWESQYVYLDVGGTGTLTVTRSDGSSETIPISGSPDIRTVVSNGKIGSGVVTIAASKGLELYSFTFG
jgi:cytochrome c biogenesis protein CcdA/thiol-disulfide isomerase/thioredoxin